MAGFRVGPEFGRAVRTKDPGPVAERSAPDRCKMSVGGFVGIGLGILAVVGAAAFLVLSVMRGEGLRPYPTTRPGLWTFPIVGLTALTPVLLAGMAVAL